MRTLAVAVVLSLLVAAPAAGLTIDPDGTVAEWGVTPFSEPVQSNTRAGNLWYTISNDYSPINYPSGVGHQPSPGLASTGELVDLEALYVRVAGTQMKALVVTSSPGAVTIGSTFHLGDLFMDFHGQRYGIVTQAANQGLAAGSVFRIDDPGDTVILEAGSRSYLGTSYVVTSDYAETGHVQDIAGPWAVAGDIDVAQLLGAASVDSATFDYGGSEDDTWLYEYSWDLGLMDLDDPGFFGARIAWGCGNDTIRVYGGETGGSFIPEPTTLLVVVGFACMAGYARRRRNVTA
jgi:hypothetical protein